MAQSRRAPVLQFDVLESRDVPSSTWLTDGFDSGEVVGSAPVGWTQWSGGGSSAPVPYTVSSGAALSGSAGLTSPGSPRYDSRAWLPSEVPADYAAAASVRADDTGGAGVVVRGKALDTSTPSYLSASVAAGGRVEFYEINGGKLGGFVTVIPVVPAPTNAWLRVTVEPTGTAAVVRVQRLDTGEYLNSTGSWTDKPVEAVRTAVGWNPSAGAVGLIRSVRGSGAVSIDNFSVTAPGLLSDTFDSPPAGSLPDGWKAWANLPGSGIGFRASNAQVVSDGPSNLASLAWTSGEVLPADVRATGSILATSLIPGGVIARGTNLDSPRPTYYAAVITRGLSVQLVKVIDGVETVLGSVRSTAYTSGQWVRVTLSANGDALQAIVYRTDTQKWLSATGVWQDVPVSALEVRDRSIVGIGLAGFLRKAGAAGPLSFDDFAATPPAGPGPVPRVAMTPNTPQASGVVTLRATTDDPSSVRRIEFQLAGTVVSSSATAPAQWTLDTATLANGPYDLTVRAIDGFGTAAETVYQFQVNNPSPSSLPSLPAIPRKYPNIRIAELAYAGNPMGAFEQSLLRSSVDLVIPNPQYLSTIDAASPATPQLLYSNVSNLYQGLLADWLTYADRNRSSREQAFYHVTSATPFQGNSPSSQPVTYFWGVTRTTPAGAATDLTAAAHGGRTFGVEFGGTGTAVNVGYLEKYREINVTLNRPATAGWGGVWEYAAATDSAGSVSQWKTLSLASDGTNGLRQNGRIAFDPPADWVPGIVPGNSGRNYYLRFRATSGTAAQGPEAKTLLGRDYVGANGGTTGTIPAFDYAADKNGDGYLSDAEYATRAAGKDARFAYETRLFYPYYGQMRFVTNPTSPIVQRWAADYHQRLLAANPLADGVFLDNSLGKIPVAGVSLAESTANYGADLGKLIATTWKTIAPKFVMANTAGGQAAADPVVANSAASFEEFLLRPTDATWSSVNDVAALVRRRLNAVNPSPYLTIDSSPGSTSPTDPRTQVGTLAYYYLVADPVKTFLMFYGGSAPASSWHEHWSPAAAVNVGQPTAAMTTFATGRDPQNAALTYKVFGRSYGNALVLYKPRSYTAGVGTGTTDNATATTHPLNGSYRAVNADGTLGPVITQVTLRNGEGAVLMRS